MSIQLFVRSQRTTSIVRRTLSPEEAKAKDDLRREGIKFRTVDLSRVARRGSRGGFTVIKVTPTLFDERNPAKIYVGARAISEYIEETRAAARRTPIHWITRNQWV